MIATVATVCLVASATAADPAASSHEGRQLSGYTQSLGEPCNMASY